MKTTTEKAFSRLALVSLAAFCATTFGATWVGGVPAAQAASAATLSFFSAPYYLTNNSDVKASWTGAPVDHYIQSGAAEGRKPASWFDADYYKKSDSAFSGMTALQLFEHYCLYGYKEGRIPSGTFANFNAAKYLADYPDLGKAGIVQNTALRHYIGFGITEGRSAYTTGGTKIP